MKMINILIKAIIDEVNKHSIRYSLMMLIAIILFTVIAPCTHIKGDVNANGYITAVDYEIIKDYYFGIEKLDRHQRDLADMNNDGIIDIIDREIIRLIVLEVIEYSPEDYELQPDKDGG